MLGWWSRVQNLAHTACDFHTLCKHAEDPGQFEVRPERPHSSRGQAPPSGVAKVQPIRDLGWQACEIRTQKHRRLELTVRLLFLRSIRGPLKDRFWSNTDTTAK